MPSTRQSRRAFLRTGSAVAFGSMAVPYVFTADAQAAEKPRSKNDRFRIGAIGMHNRGTYITRCAAEFGDVVAIADVDREVAEKAKADFGGKADLYEDYRKLLDRKDVDAVMIGSPDHWHTAMAINACRAGKDVFCEKPLTLTVAEGRPLVKVVEETKAVFQVGTWRRSEEHFRLACEMVRQGRLGKLERITCILGPNPQGGPFETKPVPAHLNWDMWLGQSPLVDYCPERCHKTFRWWVEYSGGQTTDWGAHHIDIAQWVADRDRTGPFKIDGKATFPNVENGYNQPIKFEARLTYEDGLEIVVLDEGRSGVLIEGSKGRIFVNHAAVSGAPAEQLADNPLPPDQYRAYPHDNPAHPPGSGNTATQAHMANFFDCVKSRNVPISDVESQHRTVTMCHLANICMRLGRPIQWDAKREQCTGDDEANAMLSRPQRAGYENPV